MDTTIDQRLVALKKFVNTSLKSNEFTITSLAGDASFRRYFRVISANATLVAMDAPPEKEDCLPFVTVAKIFHQKKLQVPKIITADFDQGFLLLSDLGDALYFRILQTMNADRLYKNAIDEIPRIQSCQQEKPYLFPDFTPMITEELARFREWYLLKYLRLSLTAVEEQLLADTFSLLKESATKQPQGCVHRDYHSRNLLALPNNKVGILDFQDAVWGPVTYDLVSLIRDCYIDWPASQVIHWAEYYHQLALEQKIINVKDNDTFMRWFDLMGVQRHLKAIYIFARKFLRDGNSNYLNDIPRTLKYIINVTEKYPELKKFRIFIESL